MVKLHPKAPLQGLEDLRAAPWLAPSLSPESDAVQEYLFLGYEPRFYPLWEGQTFTANQGDVKAFENPPTDGLWVPAEKPGKAPKALSAPDSEEAK